MPDKKILDETAKRAEALLKELFPEKVKKKVKDVIKEKKMRNPRGFLNEGAKKQLDAIEKQSYTPSKKVGAPKTSMGGGTR